MLLRARDTRVYDILQLWRNNRLEFTDLSDLARNRFCAMAISAANDRVFSVDGHFSNSRIFTNSALRKKLTKRFHIFSVFKTFCWL